MSLLKIIFQGLLCALVGAIFLRYAVRIVCKFTPRYGISYLLYVLSFSVSNILGYFLAMAGGWAYDEYYAGIAWLFAFVIGIFSGGVIYGWMFVSLDSEKIGLRKGFLVSLVMTGVVLVMTIIRVAIFWNV